MNITEPGDARPDQCAPVANGDCDINVRLTDVFGKPRIRDEHHVRLNRRVIATVVIGTLYFLRSLIALSRPKGTRAPTVIVNTRLGWTVIGWIVALAMSAGGGGNRQQMVPMQSGMPTPQGVARLVPTSFDSRFERCWSGMGWDHSPTGLRPIQQFRPPQAPQG